ncbi:MAG: ribosome maturation factor RimM [Candidatus Melainabacteria bacterium]|jgi:16S rRNA processing protein RimM
MQEKKDALNNKTANSLEVDSKNLDLKKLDLGELVCIGQIIKPHGVKGHFKALFTLPGGLRLEDLAYVILEKAPFKLQIREARFIDGNFALIAFKSINSPEAGNEYRGEKIHLPKSFIGELPESEFYIADLIGAEVFDEEKKEIIGHVMDFEDIPGNALLRIKLNETTATQLALKKASLDEEKNAQIIKKEKKNIRLEDKKSNDKDTVFLLPFVDEYIFSVHVDSEKIQGQINKIITVKNWEMFMMID